MSDKKTYEKSLGIDMPFDEAIKRIANEVVIAIKDNGTGIDPRHINTIFEPKFTTKNSGMGLGLGIIKNIIENYNGTITFETKFGRGTIFTVTLPIINS